MHTTSSFRSVFCYSSALLAVTAFAVAANSAAPSSRAGGEDRPPSARGSRPPHPLLGLFDTDRDGVISAAERAAAAAALGRFDQNGDGRITRDELPKPPPHPPRPPRGEGDGDDFGPPPPPPDDEAP